MPARLSSVSPTLRYAVRLRALLAPAVLSMVFLAAPAVSAEPPASSQGHSPSAAAPGRATDAPSTSTLASAPAQTVPPPLYLLMDTSGSMKDGKPDSKLTLAKRAAYAIIRDLPANQQVTLVNYPGVWTVKPIEGCSTGEVRFGPAVADKAKLAAEIRSMVADGGTPTGPALQAIGRAFVASGATGGIVMLLSDGEANCGTTDVCTVAKDLRDKGLELTVNTVALDLSDEGAKQLECIANATGGKAVRVDKDGNLTEAMTTAAGAKVSVTVHAPPALEAVTGQRDLGSANQIAVVVTSTGAVPARDVRVTLTIADANGRPGAAYVPHPVRHLGTLGGAVTTATASFQPRPLAGTPSPLTWTATVTTGQATPLVFTGTLDLSDSAKLVTAGPLLTEAKHVVILGDSYSSGEGGKDYDADADGKRQSGEYLCHRSAHAYGRQVFNAAQDAPFGASTATLTMLACSGAVTDDLVMYQHVFDIQPQLTRLKDLATKDNPPDLVLLTLGGNDAKFADFVTACVATGVLVDGRSLTTWYPCRADPNSTSTPDVEHYLVTSTLIADLKARYRDIDAVINAPEVTARRGGRVAQIVVLPYVNPLPPPERLRAGCFFGLAEYEASMAEDLITKVNGAVATAVQTMQAEGMPVRYVAPIVESFQDGHTICDEQTAVRVDSVLWRKLLDANPLVDRQYARELMHPNELGYHLEAQTLIEWSRTQPANWTTPHTPSQAGLELEQPYTVWVRRSTSPYALAPLDLGPRIPEPQDRLLDCEPVFGVSQCETIKKTKLRMVHVESEARYLGTSWGGGPDGLGDLGEIALPADLPPGEHTLVLYAVDAAGGVQRFTAPIHVYPQGTRDSIRLVFAGLLLVLVGVGYGALRRKRTAE